MVAKKSPILKRWRTGHHGPILRRAGAEMVEPKYPTDWRRRHLLDVESLTAGRDHYITGLCRVNLRPLITLPLQNLSLLSGRTIANLFFENSTRTRNSFSLAAERLGADTIEFSSSGSSTSKGETFIDTAKTIEAMGVDAVVVRHATRRALRTCYRPHLNCCVLNAGRWTA